MKKRNDRNGIVYSTDPNYRFESDEEEADTLPPVKQCLYVRREVRNGKPVVVVKEFIGKADDLRDLEKKLKSHCGVGGTSKDGDILIQGDLKDKVQAFLEKLGYRTKG